MKIFFDNCLSPVLAESLNGFVAHLGHRAFHIKDLPCGRDASDEDWITLLAKDADDWLVVTGDGRIAKSKALRLAYWRANLFGYVLAPAYQKQPLNQVCSTLLWHWPLMESAACSVQRPALFELPMQRGGKLKSLTLR